MGSSVLRRPGFQPARSGRTIWAASAGLAWAFAATILGAIFVLYASYAAAVVVYPFGLNYSEGLIWQQALWLGGPLMYGDISHSPFLVFEYPPVYLLLARGLAATGVDMLVAGRLISVVSTLLCTGMVGMVVLRITRDFGRWPARAAALTAALLPFTLLPVISWSPLMRVDMLGLAFTYGGLLLAVSSLRRPALLYAAILLFVLACTTKQTFVAAPIAVLGVSVLRRPGIAIRAGLSGCAVGLSALGLLSWLTQGGFLRHILLYNINRFSLAIALGQTGQWLTAYPVFAILVLVSLGLMLRAGFGTADARGVAGQLRTDDRAWLAGLLALYLVLCTATLAFAGKSGASINYFLEFLVLWCVFIGWLVGYCLQMMPLSRPLAICLPLALVLQISHVPADLALLHRAQLAPGRTAQAQALLDRVRAIPGPILSDDMVLLRRAGKEVDLEPAILAELSLTGRWHEQTLIDMLTAHGFGAVVTAYGPGDPTFDARYLPRTQAAMLAAYPRVEPFGDYRLRLPALDPHRPTR